MILALNSSNANRSVSLFPPTTEVTNKPHHQRRIKACMKKEEDGGDELHWESPICNMVEEAVGTSVYYEGRLIWLCRISRSGKFIKRAREKKFGARILGIIVGLIIFN